MNQSSSTDGWIVPAAFSVALVMIAQQVAGKAIRDAFFLGVFAAEVLPKIMTVASILSVVSVFAVTYLYRRRPPAVLVPAFFFASGGWFALEWLVSQNAPGAAAVSVYIHTTSFGAVAISGFWSVLNERFDPYTAKRVIGRVAGGATLGGLVGGFAAWQGAASVSISTMLLVLCGANLFCGAVLSVVGRGSPSTVKASEKAEAPWQVLEETPYLAHLAVVVGLLALGTAGIDYAFKAAAAAAYPEKSELVSFFALFYLAVGIVTFVVQTAVGGRIIRYAGLGGAIATLPGIIIVAGGLAVLYPELLLLALLRGGAATTESSLYRSGYELLYTPLAPSKKRSAKTFIDVGADKLGGAVGGAVAVFVVGLAPSIASVILLLFSLVCAAAALGLTRQLARGYVGALEESLASGRVDARMLETDDAATHAIVLKTLAHIERPEIRRMPTSSTMPIPKARSGPLVPKPPIPTVDPTGDLRALDAFVHKDPGGLDWVLRHRADAIPAQWVPGLLRLLGDPEFADVVLPKLATVAPPHVGLLSDTLLNRGTPLEVRRRTIDVLSRIATERSAQGLVAALRTEPFEIRYRAAVALSDVTAKNANISLSENVIYAAGTREVDGARTNFFGSGTAGDGQLSLAGIEAGRSVAFCVRLLSLILAHEPMYHALDALGEEDAGRRGTGLEYFENVLPPDVQVKLLPFFSNRSIAKYARRSDQDILAEIATEEHDIGRAMDRLLQRARQQYGERRFLSSTNG